MICLAFAVREKIGAIATPDYIQNAPGLPKTRSGKLTGNVNECSMSHNGIKHIGSLFPNF